MRCIAIVLFGAIIFAEATVPKLFGAGSTCTVRISRQERHYAPYPETYKEWLWGMFYKIKTRWNYRVNYATVWVTERRCCLGYEERNNTCEPVCSTPCGSGFCSRPNVCECLPGYFKAKDSKVCEPVCETGCENGVCASPNRCVCNEGYSRSENRSQCLPTCNEDCAGNNAVCIGPDTCTCNPGFERIENASSCTPICEQPCVNGECVAPDVCSCKDGFQTNPFNAFLCDPKCEQGCAFGACTAPEVCTCDPGYKLANRGVCQPICGENCHMGACIAPETCQCNDGFGLLGNSRYDCLPICEKGCVNGDCIAPGVCVCRLGYVVDFMKEAECKPFCKIPCEPHGVCVEPNNCSCEDGYRMVDVAALENEVPSNVTKGFTSACEPVCDQRCVNGECTEPNVCSCNPGYDSSSNPNVCDPVCESPCGPNSTCTEFNVCICLEGYQPVENDLAKGCEPICEDRCENGTCSGPNVCTCHEGFVNGTEGRCVPFCECCVNATCVGPNVCRCLEGFVPANDSVCVPFCENACRNGDCVGPNECRCHSGYVVNRNGTCHGARTRKSSGYDCTGDRKSPRDGEGCLFGWTGQDCDQPTVCLFVMGLDDEDVNSVTVHNETNSTFSDAVDCAPLCLRCNEALSNESMCFAIRFDDGPDQSAIGCFVDTQSPCYMMYQNVIAEAMSVTGTIAVIAILVMAAGTAAAYFAYRREQRKRMCSVVTQRTLLHESVATESLLSEETIPFGETLEQE